MLIGRVHLHLDYLWVECKSNRPLFSLWACGWVGVFEFIWKLRRWGHSKGNTLSLVTSLSVTQIESDSKRATRHDFHFFKKNSMKSRFGFCSQPAAPDWLLKKLVWLMQTLYRSIKTLFHHRGLKIPRCYKLHPSHRAVCVWQFYFALPCSEEYRNKIFSLQKTFLIDMHVS